MLFVMAVVRPSTRVQHVAQAFHSSCVRRFSTWPTNRVGGTLPRTILVRGAAAPVVVSDFAALGLMPALQQALVDINISSPTEVQALAFPLISAKKNVLVASHTGSGKTLAYLLPIIQEIKRQEAEEGFAGRAKKPRVLVLSPTRELTEQIGSVAKSLSHFAKFRSTVINAGLRLSAVKQGLLVPIDIVVATPSKVLESMDEGALSIADVQFLVIDEADTMFDRSFGEEVVRIMRALARRGERPATVLVSATMTKAVKAVIAEHVPDIQTAATSSLHKGIRGSTHSFVPIEAGRDKVDVLYQVIGTDARAGKRLMVFCNSVASCRAVDHFLNEGGLATVCYHGEMPMDSRKRTITAFTDPAVANTPSQPILVCTDIAARGLDMPSPVSHVVNFDMPLSPIDYLHRSGRTARAGSSGATTSLMQSALDRTLGHRIEWALNRGEPLDELSPLKDVKPAGALPKRTIDDSKGSHHRKSVIQEARAAQQGRAARGRGERGRDAPAGGGRSGGRGRSEDVFRSSGSSIRGGARSGRGAGRGGRGRSFGDDDDDSERSFGSSRRGTSRGRGSSRGGGLGGLGRARGGARGTGRGRGR